MSCACVKALSSPFLSITSFKFFICFMFRLTDFLHYSPCPHFESLLILAFLMVHDSALFDHTPYQSGYHSFLDSVGWLIDV